MKLNSTERSFIFWQKWLLYTSIASVITGIAIALFGNNILFQPHYKLLAHVFWNSSVFPTEVEQFRMFMSRPLGGTIACCYIMLTFIVQYPFKNKEPWARNAIIAAFGGWVIIDSSVCIFYGVYAQVYLINAFSIIVKALPILFTWKHFKQNHNVAQ
jgi:hypothetical protein